MSGQTIDYDALAKKAGAVSSEIDYDALAKQHGAVPSDGAAAPQSGPMARFFGNAWDKLNPLPALKTVIDVATAGPYSPETRQLVQGIIQAHADQVQKAQDAWDKGQHTEAAGHLLGALVPLIGPAAANAGEQMGGTDAVYDKYGHEIQPGKAPDIAGGLGSGAGLIGGVVAPGAISKVRGTATVGRILPKANPTVTAALDYLESKGVPGNAAARSGSGFVKQVQKLADSTPLGAVVANNAEQATTAALTTEAGALTARATPAVPADTLYAKFRAAEADPANLVKIQTGTKLTPETQTALDTEALQRFNQGYDGLDFAQKRLVESSVQAAGGKIAAVPVVEEIALPVRVGTLKDALRPIYDEMQWMAKADKNVSAGYTAVENILKGPDVVPASVAEMGLRGVKAMARDGSGRTASLAKFIVPKLQDIIDTSVAKAGRGAVQALQEGRIAAASEMGVEALQKILAKGQAEGGMSREAGMLADWQRLKDKNTLFRTPGLADDIGKFFLGAKKLAENPNPSGSGLVSWVAGQSALAVTHPLTGIPYLIGAGGLSKLLHSSAGVRALTNGVRISLDATAPAAAKAAAANQILKLAGQDAQLVQPGQLPAAASSSDPSQQTVQVATALPQP